MLEDPGFVPFEAVDHTADLAYVARGRTLDELFRNAAAGMLHLLYDVDAVRAETETAVEAEAADLEELLVAWLQELLYRIEVRRRAFRDFPRVAVEAPSPGRPARLAAVARGEAWDPRRHALQVEIKAATYHGLAIERERRGAEEIYRARLVLDI